MDESLMDGRILRSFLRALFLQLLLSTREESANKTKLPGALRSRVGGDSDLISSYIDV